MKTNTHLTSGARGLDIADTDRKDEQPELDKEAGTGTVCVYLAERTEGQGQETDTQNQ